MQIKKRIVGVALFLFFLFGLLVLQFYKIQIIEGEKWTKVAKMQHQLLIVEPFKRGLFYSNSSVKSGHPDKPVPFVVDVPKFHLFVDPQSIPGELKEEIALKLSSMVKLDKRQFYKKSRSRKLAMWLDREKKEEIEKYWQTVWKKAKLPKNALFFIQDYQRSYPFGKMLGQVLHTVREDKIPSGGLELVFDKYLKGKEGKRLLLRSPRHPLDTDKILALPEDGADIYLTINHYLQAVAEEEIAKAVQKANAKGGCAILMDPYTGEILALAQYPFFDPSDYRKYFNDPLLREETKVKGVSDAYEPGSTLKPITIAIALMANEELKKQGKPPIFSPLDKIATSPCSLPGRSKVVKDTSNHPYLNMTMALQKSSNVYMAKLAQKIVDRLGDGWYRNALAKFSFGKKSGIELFGETAGLLPTPGKKHPNGALEWSAPTPYSLAFGHNIMVNVFQMLRAYAIIANGGYEVNPTLVKKIVKNNQVILESNHEPSRRVLDEYICTEVLEACKFITKPGGTASKADIPGYTEGGKTGTSEKIVAGQYSKSIHFSTFIGFAPAKHPRFVMMIVIDEPEKKYVPGLGKNQMAGNCAAPAFSAIGLRTLQYLGVEPDDPNNNEMLPKVRALKTLYDQWNRR